MCAVYCALLVRSSEVHVYKIMSGLGFWCFFLRLECIFGNGDDGVVVGKGRFLYGMDR